MSIRYERIWESASAAAALARTALRPASLVYGLGVKLHAAAYDRGLATIERAPLAVVSIGNLRVGGSGKTPLTLWLAAQLAGAGKRPAIVTRGYGAVVSPEPLVLRRDAAGLGSVERNGAESFRAVVVGAGSSLPEGIADEALLLALRGESPVIVSPDRLRGTVVAAALGCDVALLDDGFQHRRLHRDLDVVLTSEGDRTARLLPSGPLRESLASLARADVVVATDDAAPSLSRPRFNARQVARGLVDELVPSTTLRPAESLRGQEVVAVAGIARPERFLGMLMASGATIATKPLLFPDHHDYSSADVAVMLRAAGSDRRIVTTEKDLVKLGRLVPPATRLEALRIDIEIDRGEAFLERVLEAIDRLDARPRPPHHR